MRGMKWIRLVLGSLVLFACDSSTAPVIASHADSFARIQVSVEIQGDASLFGGYVAIVDGSTTQSLTAGAPSSLTVSPGDHSVAIQPGVIHGTGGIAPWCAPLLPTSKTVAVPAGGVALLTFGFHCEPLNGRGLIRLNLVSSGSNAPAEVDVILRAGLIRRSDHIVSVPMNQTTDLLLGPNIYQLGIDSPLCPLPNGPFSVLPSGFIIQPDRVLYLSVTLTCN